MESIDQTFSGVADFGKKVTCTISRNGDAIHKVYLRTHLPSVTVPSGKSFKWVDWIGHALIKSVEVEIGGQRIDRHYGEWLHIWNELTQTAGHALGYAQMVGATPTLTTMTDGAKTVDGETLYIPLQFWFCRNPGLALPLIALQYHECKINLEFRDKADLYYATDSTVTVGALEDTTLMVDYIYLDSRVEKQPGCSKTEIPAFTTTLVASADFCHSC